MPFPKGLPRALSLIDCQGSDSLNPLDAADVQAIGQRADTLLYVVQSRLGLRDGDRAYCCDSWRPRGSPIGFMMC